MMDKKPVPDTLKTVNKNLTEELRAEVCRFVYSRVGSCAISEDWTQEILIKAARAHPTLREPDKLESWVFRIARNRIHDFFRASRGVSESKGGRPWHASIFQKFSKSRILRVRLSMLAH